MLQTLAWGFLDWPWVGPMHSWHCSPPCPFQPFCLLCLPSHSWPWREHLAPRMSAGGRGVAEHGGAGRGGLRWPCGTTSTEITAAAPRWPSHRCAGTPGLADLVSPPCSGSPWSGPGSGSSSVPPLGTSPARRAVCGQHHLHGGPGRRCPRPAPLGAARSAGWEAACRQHPQRPPATHFP